MSTSHEPAEKYPGHAAFENSTRFLNTPGSTMWNPVARTREEARRARAALEAETDYALAVEILADGGELHPDVIADVAAGVGVTVAGLCEDVRIRMAQRAARDAEYDEQFANADAELAAALDLN